MHSRQRILEFIVTFRTYILQEIILDCPSTLFYSPNKIQREELKRDSILSFINEIQLTTDLT